MLKKVVIMFFMSFLATPCYAGDFCSGVNLSAISKHAFLPAGIKLASKKSVESLGLCEVILKRGGQYFTLYANPPTREDSYVMIGRIFRNHKDLSALHITELRKSDFASMRPRLDEVAAFTYQPRGEVKHTLYMITDPLCPFCHKAESGIKKLLKENRTRLKVILYSVHPPLGEEKAIEAVCRRFGLDEYLKDGWRKARDQGAFKCKSGKALISETKRLMAQLGVRSVPVFYLEDGSMVSGANMRALERLLKN